MGHLGHLVSFLKRTYAGLLPSCHSKQLPLDGPLPKTWRVQVGKRVRRTVYLLLALFAGLASCPLVLAQNSNLQIDPRNSDARLFLTSTTMSGASVNVGVARVEGNIKWNATDPGTSVVEFAIYPANQGAPELYPSIKNSEKSYQAAENYVVLRFRSKSVVPLGKNSFRVAGTLSVTRVERLADYDPSKGYSGPVYLPAVVHSSEAEATFEFHAATATEATAAGQFSDEWQAMGAVKGQDLPELMKAVAVTRWPAFVEQERCIFPSSTGEDFSGPVCTGKTIELQPRTNVLCQTKPLPGGPFVAVRCPGASSAIAEGGASGTNAKRVGSEQRNNGALVTDEVSFQLKLQLNRQEVVRAGLWGH